MPRPAYFIESESEFQFHLQILTNSYGRALRDERQSQASRAGHRTTATDFERPRHSNEKIKRTIGSVVRAVHHRRLKEMVKSSRNSETYKLSR
jgi:hypothetical protein